MSETRNRTTLECFESSFRRPGGKAGVCSVRCLRRLVPLVIWTENSGWHAGLRLRPCGLRPKLPAPRFGTELMQLERVFRWCSPNGLAWANVLAGYQRETGKTVAVEDYTFMIAMAMFYYHVRIVGWGKPDPDVDQHRSVPARPQGRNPQVRWIRGPRSAPAESGTCDRELTFWRQMKIASG